MHKSVLGVKGAVKKVKGTFICKGVSIVWLIETVTGLNDGIERVEFYISRG